MQLDGLWTVHTLLALCGLAFGNQVSNEPLAAPRVFISFKGGNLNCSLLPSSSLLLLILGLLLAFLCFSQCWFLLCHEFAHRLTDDMTVVQLE